MCTEAHPHVGVVAEPFQGGPAVTGLLEGRNAVVIGGGQMAGETTGNGRATALVYARAGARVLVADRDVAAAQDTVDLIHAEGLDAEARQADVCEPDDVAALAAAAVSLFGDVHILHNNVGILVQGNTEELPIDQWRRVLEVNLTGMWLSCKYFLPLLRSSGNAVIINISSLAGLIPAAPAIAYSTTKAAVNAMTRSLALEYAPLGVRVNCIAPGAVDTPLGVDDAVRTSGRSRAEVVSARESAIPMGRAGTAWDVAYAARFLASYEAGFITGAVLPVDGGASLAGVPDSASGRAPSSNTPS